MVKWRLLGFAAPSVLRLPSDGQRRHLLTGLHAVYAINRACLVSNTCTSEFFEQEKGIRLHRITATDDALAGAIGIRSCSAALRANPSPIYVVIAAIIFVVLFISTLLTIVHIVTS